MIRVLAAAAAATVVVVLLGIWANGWEGSVAKADAVARASSESAAAVEPEEFEFAGGELETEVEAVLYDQANNTAAVVVSVSNPDPKRPIVDAPIQIELLDEAGKAIGTNTAPGTNPVLNEVPSIPSGETVLYVNDTIVPQGVPVSARVKATGTPTDEKLTELEAEGAVEDSVYGVSAIGSVLNPSAKTLENVRVEAVVRKSGTIVAAGGALIEQLEGNATADFQIFLIGAGEGGKLELWAPAR